MSDKKIALVTGANRGLGRAIAEQLNDSGVHVLVGCRSADSHQDNGRDDFQPLMLDVADADSVNAAKEYILGTFGRLDILINNAGLFLDFDTSRSYRERYQAMFDVNVYGAALTTEMLTPVLESAGTANVVNISSSLGAFGLRTDPNWAYADMKVPFYAASKAALNALTISQAQELAPKGIRVNAVCPGLTATEATQFRGRSTAESAKIAVSVALQGGQGLTGTFLNDEGNLPW